MKSGAVISSGSASDAGMNANVATTGVKRSAITTATIVTTVTTTTITDDAAARLMAAAR